MSLGLASLAGAQSLGTFKWQLQPYCNILTLNVTQTGGTYALDGFDDQCGASTRASATGTAFLNPDGTIGLGISIVTTPSGAPIHVDATISLATLNGTWLKHHGGNALIGTCSSDARFKRDITPFVAALERVAALRPVHYYWRSAEFPEKAFGTQQAYGLIAQDVADVLPELVVTGADGYMAVDYAKLPLLAIQAIKELKEKNDALERRLAEIEGAFSRLSAEREPR